MQRDDADLPSEQARKRRIEAVGNVGKRDALAGESQKAHGQKLVGAVADGEPRSRTAERLGERLFERRRLRIGIQTRIGGILRRKRRHDLRRRWIRVLVGVELQQIGDILGLFAGRIGGERARKRLVEEAACAGPRGLFGHRILPFIKHRYRQTRASQASLG